MSALPVKDTKGSKELDLQDLGTPDSLRYNVLSLVVSEEYDRAILSLKELLDQSHDYRNYRHRIERYAQHGIDLIYAIRTKRNFPGMGLLTRNKQQELRDKFKEHFSELKIVMKKLEACQEELRISDIRSTTIVVKAMWYSVVVVAVSAFVIELIHGLGTTMYIVFDDYFSKAVDWIFVTLKM